MTSAGDVNGDGYSDVVVGAPGYDNGEMGEGRAYVYHGSPSGLSTTPVWTAESDHNGASFGLSVSSAGDVNGDGFGDVVIGAPDYHNGVVLGGRVYVYLGSPIGLLATPDLEALSFHSYEKFGISVSTAGDVNADGYSDVIVGASGYDNGEQEEGRAYVYYGSESGLQSSIWTSESNQERAQFGACVSSAGDVNGDGYGDVIVGAPYYSNGESDEGRAFVYLGSAAGLSASAAWSEESNQNDAHFGKSVAGVGDVNGDGYSDVIVGAPFQDTIDGKGKVYGYYGSSSGLSGSLDWQNEGFGILSGELGYSVSSAGDVNGDGYSDVIVGAPLENTLDGTGRVYGYYGSSSGLSSTADWQNEGFGILSGLLGVSVSTAGDLNGDGYADVVVGAPDETIGSAGEGQAYVYYGSKSGLSWTPDVSLGSGQSDGEFGTAVCSAGDVNGDGFSDVIVGAPEFDNGQSDEGRAYIYLGSSSGLRMYDGWTAESDQADAQFSYSVASTGDVNGDGYSDVIVGARYYDNGESNEGRAFVYLGSATGLSATASWTAESNQANACFGYSVASAGDVNGDGYSDVIVGALLYDNGQSDEGRTFVYLGSASGLDMSAAWTAESNQASAYFGTSVASAGDVNGDGYSDVIVGAPGYSNGQTYEGCTFLFLGSAAGLNFTPAWTAESDQERGRLGQSVSCAGDVNGDGYSDVIVGATTYDNGESDEGRAYVYLGSASGLEVSAVWSAESDQAYAYFGRSVASAGDVNGDGYSDVIVGASQYDNGESEEGRAYVYMGSPSGPGIIPVWTAESDQDSAAFGNSVSSAGDVNGDGYSDVIVGANLYSHGQADEGRVFVFLGSAAGLSFIPAWTAESNKAGAGLGGAVASAGDVNGDGYSDVIVGASGYNDGESNEGVTFVYYGNNGAGLSMLPGQFRGDGTTPVQLNALNDTSAVLKLRGYAPMGRTRVKLQWQVNELGIPFGGPGAPGQTINGQSTDWIDTVDGTSMITETISGLSVNTPYHWRVRLLYHPADALTGQIASRWYSIQDNGWNDVDFRTTNPSYTISGTVTDGTNPVPGVTITFSHDGGSVVTDASGDYTYDVPYGTTTTVSASHSGYSNWSPPFIVLHNITVDQPNQDFMATANGYIVSGTVTDGTNPINGAAITFSHDGSVVYSNVSGAYSTTVPYGTSTTITPSAAGYSSWSPPSRTLTDISSNQTGQDFAAILNGVTVSGTVTDGTNPIPDVTITFSHDSGTATTSGDGTYSYVVPYGTSTVLTPSLANHTFTPVNIPLANLTADSAGNNFIGNTESYTITATAGPGGAIDPSGLISVAHGADQSFAIIPDAGLHTDYLMVDGGIVTPATSYTFRSVMDAHSIHASFAANQPPVITAFISDRESGNLPVTVTFTVTAEDPDGGGIVRYDWDLDGNGTIDQTTTAPQLVYTFRDAGEYPVTVTVIDGEGEWTTSEPLTVTVTDATPLVLPTGISGMLNGDTKAVSTTLTIWAINPYGEIVTGTLTAWDETGTELGDEAFSLPAGGKSALNLAAFSDLAYDSITLTADHFLYLVADVQGNAFRFTCYQPLETAKELIVPHIAEETDQWDTMAWLSNYRDIGVNLTVHGDTSELEAQNRIQQNLTGYLPETVNEAASWGLFQGRMDTPFTNTNSLTGFEAFIRKGSDGAAVKLGNRTSNTLIIPHIPTETDIFWTGFAFVNPSDEPVTATATLYDNAGTIIGAYPLTIPANAKVKGVLTDLFPDAAGEATWGIIQADGAGLIGIELFGTVHDGICGFPLSGHTAETGIFPLTETDSGFWTGLAFANPNGGTAILKLELMGADGEVKVTYDVDIAPMSRSAAVVGDLFSLTELEPGDYLRFTSSMPLAAVSVSGDNARSWMSALPATE